MSATAKAVPASKTLDFKLREALDILHTRLRLQCESNAVPAQLHTTTVLLSKVVKLLTLLRHAELSNLYEDTNDA